MFSNIFGIRLVWKISLILFCLSSFMTIISANEEKFDVAIIGGGYTGVFSALLLSRLKNSDGAPALRVCLLERDEHLMNGSSLVPARLHLGGEYPKDPVTARQCLLGAMLFRQMMPTDDILTDRKHLDFLVAKDSPSTLLDEVKQRYEELRIIYKELFEEILGTGDAAARKRLEEQLFGSPEKGVFWQELSENENPNRDHFSGGIRTPERGFQPIAMGSILESLLTDNKVKVYREFNLKEAKCITTTFPRKQNYKESYKQDYGYELVPEEKREKLIISRFVVNATGYESDKTQERSIKLLCKQCPNTTVYLRSLGLLDVSKCPIPENRSYFGLIDRNGGMVSFFNRKIAAVYIPGLSERGECKGKGLEDYHLPKEGQCPDHADEVLEEDQKSILATILEDVKKKYPFLEKAEGVRLLTRTTVNWNEEIYQRQHIRPYWLGEDTRWLAARSTKATLAPLTALQVVAELINHADIEMRPEQEIPREFLKNLLKIGLSDGSNCGGTVNGATLEDFKGFSKLPELFVFRNLMCPTETTMRNYAKDRELPVEIVERAVSLLPASRGGPLINVRPLRLEPQDDTILTKLVRGIRNHRKELTIFGITTLSGLMGGLTGDYLDGPDTTWGGAFLAGFATTGAIGGGTTAILATRRWF